MSTKLYVGNLSWSTQRDDLYSLFGKYGAVEDAFIPMDRETGRPRGFGFVTMESNSAKDAIDNLNETEFMVGLLGGLGFRGALFCPSAAAGSQLMHAALSSASQTAAAVASSFPL